MAQTKSFKTKKRVTRKKAAKKTSSGQRPTYAELREQLAERTRQLNESVEQQIATSDILRVIASSQIDIQPVLEVVAENAARLCEATNAAIFRTDGTVYWLVALHGSIPIPRSDEQRPLTRSLPIGRAMIDRQTVHIDDVTNSEFSAHAFRLDDRGIRTVLNIPLLREGVAIGAIHVRRQEVRPFTEKQIALLKTFADQAVIAIENVRLFQELKESLQQQTATSEILGVIARSPTDIQPVLNAVAESAARLLQADNAQILRVDGNAFRVAASFGHLQAFTPDDVRPISRGYVTGRAIMERRTIHVHDLLAEIDTEYPEAKELQARVGHRTTLVCPLLRDGAAIGAISILRNEVRPFTEQHIVLLKTFADQAVIAIDNVRLFNELQDRNAELREALEHQTASAEVLGIISRSPTDVQPVLDAIAESAARVCGIDDVHLRLREGNTMVLRAHFGPVPLGRIEISIDEPRYRWMREHGTVHIPDVRTQNNFPSFGSPSGLRTFLAVPLRQQGELSGTLSGRRTEVRPFTPAQIKLLETFADQAVIAIENVRLFKELGERNAELHEALEHQTATSEVLGIISRSPTDVQPVLDAIVESAAKVCGIDDVVLRLNDGKSMVPQAHFGSVPMGRFEISTDESQYQWMREYGALHIPDARAQNDFPEVGSGGSRTFLLVPLRQQGELIGLMGARRIEVRPFTPAQIKLLETFADQAVIAIENVRLFKELNERNAELREALEHQTATAEVLGIISRSPTDVQPVLDAIVESAARVCGIDDVLLRLREGDSLVTRAHFGSIPIGRIEISIDEPQYRWLGEHGTLHVPDVRAQDQFPTMGAAGNWPTMLFVPLRQQGELIGNLAARRTEVHPFSAAQVKLLETFADQAVIAIENVRLFNELKESLEQQTATSEVLKVISRSAFELEPVLQTLLENATRLCGADHGTIHRVQGDTLPPVATYRHPEELKLFVEKNPPQLTRETVAGRVMLERRVIHIPDLTIDPDYQYAVTSLGLRTVLGVPLLREGNPIGVLIIFKTEVQPFTEKQIDLVRTFADQAVIAIENVRLLQELQERTRALTASVEELKALGEVGRAVSSTLDVETVLTRIVSHAVQLSGTDGGAIYEYDEQSEEFLLRATDHMEEELITALRANPPRLGDGVVGRAALTRQPVEVPNILEERAYAPHMRQLLERYGFRASLAVPLLREEKIIGGLVVRRKSTGAFRPEVIELVKTFATQSVLAIQNARLFREIEDKSRQIEAANQHKSEFLANMSHELRTPLNAIIGFSEVLGERLFGELNEKQAEYTQDILTSGQHLLSLINEILDLSKVEAGRMELETASFDLPLAIDNARTFVRERATKHGITLDVKVDEQLGDFVGDERKIKQILLNLLSNAVKFTPEGGLIKIDARQADGSVEISVSDTGIGIAPDDLPKIFEEFRQVGTDYAHKSEGTGLGLTLAKKFVELHGGKIWVTSQKGAGSTFTFTLPTTPPAHIIGKSATSSAEG